jgi:hypothetical protein
MGKKVVKQPDAAAATGKGPKVRRLSLEEAAAANPRRKKGAVGGNLGNPIRRFMQTILSDRLGG